MSDSAFWRFSVIMAGMRGTFEMTHRYILAVFFLLVLSLPAQAEKRKVSIVAAEFAPYISESVPGRGWAWQVASLVFDEQGYHPELTIMPWARAVEMTRLGKADGLYMANRNPEREAWAVFTDPVGQETSVLFKLRKRYVTFNSLEDLSRYSIGTHRGAAIITVLQTEGVTVRPLRGFAQGIKELERQQLDLFIGDQMVTTHIIQTQFPPDYSRMIDYVPKAIAVSQLHLAVSRLTEGHAGIRDDFNRGLKILREDGRYQKILKDHGLTDLMGPSTP